MTRTMILTAAGALALVGLVAALAIATTVPSSASGGAVYAVADARW